MKILHTGDWHIGKLINGIHMTEDQRYILGQLIEFIDKEKPDVLIIAGDLYDRSIPPVEAVELLDEVLSKIVRKNNTKIIAIAGNHDSPDRVGFVSKILSENGLYIRGKFSENIEPITIDDEYGSVNFYPIPFAEPSVVREAYKDDSINNYDSAAKAIVEKINKKIDYNSRNVCIFHGFLINTGDELEENEISISDSVRPLSIGGSDHIDVKYFEKFNYVALGHLHRPQKVKYEYIRYAGSLLKYSFSEANQKKSVTLIEIDKNGNTDIKLKSFSPIRDLRIIKGEIENLTNKEIYSLASTEDYIKAIITDRGELIDLVGSLRLIYPNILKIEKEYYEREAGESKTSANCDFLKKDTIDLFAEFYENMSGEKFSFEKKKVVSGIISEINKKERNL